MLSPIIVFLLVVLAGLAVRSGLAIDDRFLHVGLVAAIAAGAALWVLHIAAFRLTLRGPGITHWIPWILALTACLLAPEAIRAIDGDGNWLWLIYPTLVLIGAAANPVTYLGRRDRTR